MNTAIPDDVDTELSRYLDAEEIRGAGIKPEQLKNKQIQYDKQRGVNNVLMRLPSGGYTKIGEEKVVDPVPPQDVGKQPPDQVFDEAAAAWTQPDRTAEIRAFQQEMPRVYEDYLAAGFTEPELQAAGIAPALPPGAARPQMTPEEVAAAGTGTIEPRDLTIREGHTDVLRQIFEGVGADPFFARQLAESVVGNPNATRDLGIGLADLTPLGAVYGGQEGYQTFTRGLDSGDNVTAALGALEAGLSVLEAIPLTAAGGRAMRGAIPGIRQTIEELGQEAQARIAREGSTLYSNPVGPVVDRALAAAGRLMGEGEQVGARAAENVDTSYRMQHQPRGPQDDNPVRLDDLTRSTTGEAAGYPEDFYSPMGPRYYAPGPSFPGDDFGKANQESYRAIRAVRGKPDAVVTIYRAVPNDPNITTINEGDFVTLSKTYAELHGASGYGPRGEEAGKILSQKVKVKDIYWDGNDVNEFGYFPSGSAEESAMMPQE